MGVGSQHENKEPWWAGSKKGHEVLMGQSEKVRNTGLSEMLLSTSEYKQGQKNFKSGLRKNALVDL